MSGDDLDTVAWQQIAKPAAKFLDRLCAAVEWNAHCESPIEVQLAAELIVHPPFSTGEAVLLPQFWVNRHRYDFAVRKKGEQEPRLFIECDGRDFHSDPEDVARDRTKDQAITERGGRILRFTGSEIFRRSAWCAERIRKALA